MQCAVRGIAFVDGLGENNLRAPRFKRSRWLASQLESPLNLFTQKTQIDLANGAQQEYYTGTAGHADSVLCMVLLPEWIR